MSFEEGGDLASFAAIAESTIASKEGKLIRRINIVISISNFDNQVSELFPRLCIETVSASSSLFALDTLTNAAFALRKSHARNSQEVDGKMNKTLLVFRDPVLPFESKSFPGLQNILKRYGVRPRLLCLLKILPQSFSQNVQPEEDVCCLVAEYLCFISRSDFSLFDAHLSQGRLVVSCRPLRVLSFSLALLRC